MYILSIILACLATQFDYLCDCSNALRFGEPLPSLSDCGVVTSDGTQVFGGWESMIIALLVEVLFVYIVYRLSVRHDSKPNTLEFL